MRIIDLLNKIANGEEVPKKIKYRNKIFMYGKESQCYIDVGCNKYNDLLMELSNHKGTDFNYEVEIIEDTPKEDKKIPEKLGLINYCEDQATLLIHHKVDEIIDYLKSKGE